MAKVLTEIEKLDQSQRFFQQGNDGIELDENAEEEEDDDKS